MEQSSILSAKFDCSAVACQDSLLLATARDCEPGLYATSFSLDSNIFANTIAFIGDEIKSKNKWRRQTQARTSP